MAKITITNEDNMQLMARYPDKYFDLAIVDPPYGLGKDWKKNRFSRFKSHISTYENSKIPDKSYFKELERVSKNQIIWGGNYFTMFLPAVNSWIVWDKNKDYKKHNMAEGELAWTSFHIPLRIVQYTWNGCVVCEPRHGFHPHEKPVKLYKWILNNYAKQDDKILDTHLGSGSIAIACHDMGFDLTACEIDKDYYESAIKRLRQYRAQLTLDLK